MKSYRFVGEEAEALGRRLDHARQALKQFKNDKSWGRNYWTEVVNRLLLQWKQLPVLHDANAVLTELPRWTVDYDYYEKHTAPDHYGLADRAYDRLFRHDANLEASWNANIEARLAKAQ